MLIDSESFAFSSAWADYLTYTNWSYQLNNNNGAGGGTYVIHADGTGPLGDNYLQVSNVGSQFSVVRSINTTSPTICIGVRINMALAANPVQPISLIVLDANGHHNLILTLSNVGGGSLSVSGLGVIGSFAGGSFPTTGWFYLELQTTLSASNGSVTIWVNGTQVYNLVNVVTQSNTSTTLLLGGVMFCAASDNGTNYALAHLYVTDNLGTHNTANLGDVRVYGSLPTADGTVTFAPNGGSDNWINASQVPPAIATDYNSSSIVGNSDTFTCAVLPTSIASIYAVNVKTLAMKTESGNRALEALMVSGTSTATGTSVNLAISPKQVSGVFAVDPATGAAWTPSGLNAATVGYQVSL